jgi:3D (Asp-Asp-Asp) domain-containing protein
VILANSLWRKLLATTFVAGGFVWLYEATILDSRFAAKQIEVPEVQPAATPGARLLFSATAYCKGSTTASGVNVRSGIAAADPDLLPVGSVVQVDAPGARYDGVYTVMDTGPRVQGRHLDLYMWSCNEALRFGKTAVRISVLRLGWSPAQSSPSLVDALFHRREREWKAQPKPTPTSELQPAPTPPGPTPPPPTVAADAKP